MATLEEIKARIGELVTRRKNVSASEIDWVVNQLGAYMAIHVREGTHGRLYRVGSSRFMVSHHNPGQKQVKPCYVDAFRDAMTELGLFEN